MTYTSIDGSIFKGNKQLMIIVAVECSKATRNRIAEKIADLLEKEDANRKAMKRKV